jgi:adenylate cyclase
MLLWEEYRVVARRRSIYSRLVEQDEAGTLAAIRDLRAGVLDPLLAEHQGSDRQGYGRWDHRRVRLGGRRGGLRRRDPEDRGRGAGYALPDLRIVFRIGVNLGDVVVEGDDLLGDGVNVAARLEQLCEPGGVLVSGTAFDHLRGDLGRASRPWASKTDAETNIQPGPLGGGRSSWPADATEPL